MLSRDTLPPPNQALADLLPASFVAPRYAGASIANLPPTIGHLLGVDEGWSGQTLEPSLLAALEGEVERVVLLLIDGVGWHKLNEQLALNDAGFADILHQYGVLKAPITTVSPATTSVATTTLLGDGSAPAEHGMLGYTFLLPELGAIANMLFWHPAWKKKPVYGELETWGLSPETFLPTASSAEVLSSAGIPMRVLMPSTYQKSPLSRMRPRGADIEGFLNATDMWLKLGTWLEESAGSKAYAYAYYADFDTLSHRDSHDARFWEPLWLEFTFHLRRFLSDLSPKARRKTLVLITADHGHVATPQTSKVLWQDHKVLSSLCQMRPGGEPRHRYLYGHKAKSALLDYARAALAKQFFAVDTADALQAGLYGPVERMHPETPQRLGDVSLLARGSHYLWDADNALTMLGMHGSLEAQEMVVPLIGLRLG